ncbi:uncharacterized protein LOC108629134 [Ceratina calcarata]|uniref:Uncharacterized protein LOC108625999 n=1 Tax=Ceratina calcarata TaxID=156304 RepID=A0AAJ7J862_9HYME|nr:uncharacterized protein LOC108625999 [Ceratina calcarata]XP_017887056.2 uncharacterized protein LOC108629134 [Ceratina calcarata]
MVRSKGNVRRVGPYREYMQLRSMSTRPPPYTNADSQRFIELKDNQKTRKQNGFNSLKEEEEDYSVPVVIRNVKPSCCKYILYSLTGVLLFVLCIFCMYLVFPYPIHASCIVKWKFEDPCTFTMQKFRCQILNWSSCVNCSPRGNRCLYRLKEPKPDESNVIRAVHITPNLKTVENIRIDFKEINKSCVATGESVSSEWFRIFDYGMNYCNLHNLATGIGFKFLELTNNAICTQHNMAICN